MKKEKPTIYKLQKTVGDLIIKVNELEQKQEEKDKLIDFLSQYNKDEVVFGIKNSIFCMQSTVNYIYNGKLEEYNFGGYTPLAGKVFVISNEKSSAILQIGENYYKLDKAKNIVVDITDIYKPKTETKKPSTKTTKTTKKKKGE